MGSGGFKGDDGDAAVVGLDGSEQKQCFYIVFLPCEAYFSRITWDAMAGRRISREVGWSGCPGGLFLEK